MPLRSVKAIESELTNMDPTRFDHFKSYMRTMTRKELKSAGNAKQDGARWDRFKIQVVQEFPELREYEERCPIEAYFRLCAKYEKNRQWKRNKSVISIPVTPPRRRTIFFVGGTPRHRPRCITRLATDSEIQTLQNPRKGLPLKTQIISEHSASVSSPDVSGEGARPNTSSSPETGEIMTDTMWQACTPGFHGSQTNDANPWNYPVPCVKCGAVPVFAPSHNKEIRNALSGLSALISVLSSLGIVSDHHLFVYRQWGTITFLDSLCNNIINPLHKAALEKHLGGDFFATRRAELHNEVASSSKFRMLSFPQPSPEHEALIVQATSSEELRKAMGLEDDIAHYILLTKYIDDAIRDMDMHPERGEWSSIVNKICDHCPELNDFQNTWPISFYVKWKHARIYSERLKNRTPKYSMGSSAYGRVRNVITAGSVPKTPPVRLICKQSPNSSAVSNSQLELSLAKGAPWSGCSLHPLPKTLDASTKLLTHLRAFGMEELLPVFLSAEIRTDDDFDLYSSFDSETRRSVFSPSVETFKLRPFQMMMLDVVIREGST